MSQLLHRTSPVPCIANQQPLCQLNLYGRLWFSLLPTTYKWLLLQAVDLSDQVHLASLAGCCHDVCSIEEPLNRPALVCSKYSMLGINCSAAYNVTLLSRNLLACPPGTAELSHQQQQSMLATHPQFEALLNTLHTWKMHSAH
jgi:hypothetical protein